MTSVNMYVRGGGEIITFPTPTPPSGFDMVPHPPSPLLLVMLTTTCNNLPVTYPSIYIFLLCTQFLFWGKSTKLQFPLKGHLTSQVKKQITWSQFDVYSNYLLKSIFLWSQKTIAWIRLGTNFVTNIPNPNSVVEHKFNTSYSIFSETIV